MGSSESLTGPTSEAPRPRALDVRWIHGSPSAKHNTDPDIQVYEYDEHTFVLRQNMAINYEAPFLFLVFGQERAVLQLQKHQLDAASRLRRHPIEVVVAASRCHQCQNLFK